MCSSLAHAEADKVAELSHVLRTDRDYKVRLTAALVLGKLRDRRATPALIAALDDRNETVRGMAASGLGQLGDESALRPLESHRRDRSDFVRARVQEAILLIRPSPQRSAMVLAPGVAIRSKRVYMLIGATDNRGRFGGATVARRLREVLVKYFSDSTIFTLEPKPNGFVIDSTVKELNRRITDRHVEWNCEVSIVVGRYPSRAIVGMTSGGATVQASKIGYQASKDEFFQAEALENAVRGAHPSLVELVHKLEQ